MVAVTIKAPNPFSGFGPGIHPISVVQLSRKVASRPCPVWQLVGKTAMLTLTLPAIKPKNRGLFKTMFPWQRLLGAPGGNGTLLMPVRPSRLQLMHEVAQVEEALFSPGQANRPCA